MTDQPRASLPSAPFAAVVAVSERVAATRSRKAKIEALAGLLRSLPSDDVVPAVGFLTGEPRQGKIGVGWATVYDLEVVPAAEPSLSIVDIDRAIDAVQATTGAQSVSARRALLRDVFARATAAEIDFLRRLLVGELRQGALEGIMSDAVAAATGVPAEAVRRAAMLTGNLAFAASVALSDGEHALRALPLTVGQPVLPMLAATSPSVLDALQACGHASVEWKLDGARIQVHRRDGDVRIFTRNLNDVTTRLDDVVQVAREIAAREFILDGEVLGFFDDERPHAFQDTMSAFGNELGRPGLVPYFFDCLHVDGRDLLDEPLEQRLVVLDRIASTRRVPRIVTDDPDTAVAFFDRTVATGHEGVMVKAIDSTYEAGRRGQSWRKVKPVHTLDLVVLAAEWGHGRRRGWLSNLHLGARVAGGFVMVGKTFKGLTDAMLEWQTAALLELEQRRDGIVVWVRPQLVVEIALDGVQSSTRYPGGVALRFARVRRYRSDKSPDDADTIDAVRALLPRRQ